jgi:hypothetical protein
VTADWFSRWLRRSIRANIMTYVVSIILLVFFFRPELPFFGFQHWGTLIIGIILYIMSLIPIYLFFKRLRPLVQTYINEFVDQLFPETQTIAECVLFFVVVIFMGAFIIGFLWVVFTSLKIIGYGLEKITEITGYGDSGFWQFLLEATNPEEFSIWSPWMMFILAPWGLFFLYGIVTVFGALLVGLAHAAVYAGRAIMWRIARYRTGPVVAVSVIFGFLMACARVFLSK